MPESSEARSKSKQSDAPRISQSNEQIVRDFWDQEEKSIDQSKFLVRDPESSL